jgi:hypothetical protein
MHYEILIQLFITVVISCACCRLLVVRFYFKIMPYSAIATTWTKRNDFPCVHNSNLTVCLWFSGVISLDRHIHWSGDRIRPDAGGSRAHLPDPPTWCFVALQAILEADRRFSCARFRWGCEVWSGLDLYRTFFGDLIGCIGSDFAPACLCWILLSMVLCRLTCALIRGRKKTEQNRLFYFTKN